ncbi:MAG: hypothetical protein EOO65_00840, partial [Methanosarcinales archaeon]
AALVINTVVGNGVLGASADGTPAINASLSGPQRVAILDTVLWIADTGNHRIISVDLGDEPVTITHRVGTGSAEYDGDDGPAASASLNRPHGLALTNDSLWIADTDNNAIRRVMFDTNFITTVQVPVDLAPLNKPHGVAVDEANNKLWIADTENDRVLLIDMTGEGYLEWSVSSPFAVCVDTSAAVSSALVLSVASGISLLADTDPNINTLASTFVGARDVHYHDGNVYVADVPAHVVRVFNITDPSTVLTFAGIAGQNDNTGDGGEPVSAKFRSPSGVVISPVLKETFIVDSDSHVVRRVRALPGASPSISSTPSPTGTCTASGTATPSASGTATPSGSGTVTPSASGTATPSASVTATPSASGTATPSGSGTATPSASVTATPSASGTATPSASGTATPSASGTATLSGSPPEIALPPIVPSQTPPQSVSAAPTHVPTSSRIRATQSAAVSPVQREVVSFIEALEQAQHDQVLDVLVVAALLREQSATSALADAAAAAIRSRGALAACAAARAVATTLASPLNATVQELAFGANTFAAMVGAATWDVAPCDASVASAPLQPPLAQRFHALTSASMQSTSALRVQHSTLETKEEAYRLHFSMLVRLQLDPNSVMTASNVATALQTALQALSSASRSVAAQECEALGARSPHDGAACALHAVRSMLSTTGRLRQLAVGAEKRFGWPAQRALQRRSLALTIANDDAVPLLYSTIFILHAGSETGNTASDSVAHPVAVAGSLPLSLAAAVLGLAATCVVLGVVLRCRRMLKARAYTARLARVLQEMHDDAHALESVVDSDDDDYSSAEELDDDDIPGNVCHLAQALARTMSHVEVRNLVTAHAHEGAKARHNSDAEIGAMLERAAGDKHSTALLPLAHSVARLMLPLHGDSAVTLKRSTSFVGQLRRVPSAEEVVPSCLFESAPSAAQLAAVAAKQRSSALSHSCAKAVGSAALCRIILLTLAEAERIIKMKVPPQHAQRAVAMPDNTSTSFRASRQQFVALVPPPAIVRTASQHGEEIHVSFRRNARLGGGQVAKQVPASRRGTACDPDAKAFMHMLPLLLGRVLAGNSDGLALNSSSPSGAAAVSVGHTDVLLTPTRSSRGGPAHSSAFAASSPGSPKEHVRMLPSTPASLSPSALHTLVRRARARETRKFPSVSTELGQLEDAAAMSYSTPQGSADEMSTHNVGDAVHWQNKARRALSRPMTLPNLLVHPTYVNATRSPGSARSPEHTERPRIIVTPTRSAGGARVPNSKLLALGIPPPAPLLIPSAACSAPSSEAERSADDATCCDSTTPSASCTPSSRHATRNQTASAYHCAASRYLVLAVLRTVGELVHSAVAARREVVRQQSA